METESKDREMIKALNQKYKELSKLRIEESEIAQKILDKRSEINALETEIWVRKNKIQSFFPGACTSEKHFSACKCASVPHKRVRAAGCSPFSFRRNALKAFL